MVTHEGRAAQPIPLARVVGAPRIDLSSGVELRLKVHSLMTSMCGRNLTITVGSRRPTEVEPYTAELIAERAVDYSLQIVFDGEPEAVRAWTETVHDLIAIEILRGRR